MIRRKFLQMMTIASVGSLAPLEALAAESATTITWLVKGFTCITCATGLDTLLGQQKGVLSSKSTYPEGKVTVRFQPAQTSAAAIVAFIAELGFTVQDHNQKS
jgi:copper chaperone CopZ